MHDGVVKELADQFDRHLQQLVEEIEAYTDENAMWRIAPGISNSGGTLALHVAGAIQYYVGTLLGGTSYERDRNAEFHVRDVPRAVILQSLADTRLAVRSVLGDMSADALGDTFVGLPERYAGATKFWFLSHLSIHLGYHLGQVNYHRRLLAAGAPGDSS